MSVNIQESNDNASEAFQAHFLSNQIQENKNEKLVPALQVSQFPLNNTPMVNSDQQFTSLNEIGKNMTAISQNEVQKPWGSVIKTNVVPTTHPVGPLKKKSSEETFVVKNLQTYETTVKPVCTKTKIQPIFGHENVKLMTMQKGPFPVIYMGPPNIVDMQGYRKMVEKENQQKNLDAAAKRDKDVESCSKSNSDRIDSTSSNQFIPRDKQNLIRNSSGARAPSIDAHLDSPSGSKVDTVNVDSVMSLPQFERNGVDDEYSIKKIMDGFLDDDQHFSKDKKLKSFSTNYDLDQTATMIRSGREHVRPQPLPFVPSYISKPHKGANPLFSPPVALTNVTDSLRYPPFPTGSYVSQIVPRFNPCTVTNTTRYPRNSSFLCKFTFENAIARPVQPINKLASLANKSIVPLPSVNCKVSTKRKLSNSPVTDAPMLKVKKLIPSVTTTSGDFLRTTKTFNFSIQSSVKAKVSKSTVKNNRMTSEKAVPEPATNLPSPAACKDKQLSPHCTKKVPELLPHTPFKRPGALVKFEDNVQLWIDRLRDLTYLDDEPVKSWNLKKGTEVAARYTDGLFYDAIVLTSYEGSTANRKKEKLKDSPEKNSPTTAKFTPKQEAVTLNKSKEKAPIQPAKSDTPMSEKSNIAKSSSLPRVHIKKLQLNDGEDSWDANLIDTERSNVNLKNDSQKETLKVKCPNCFLVFQSVSLFRQHQKTVCGSKGITVSDFQFEEGVLVKVDESKVPPIVESYSKKKYDGITNVPRDRDGKRCFRRGSRILHRWQTDVGSRWYHGKILRLLVSNKTKRSEFEIEYDDDDQDGGPIRICLYDDYPHDVRVVIR